jgi:hypothetical protein
MVLSCLWFTQYTDHGTLENFDRQKHLSCWQACWMEFLSQYEFKITYIPGEENSCADALSRMTFPDAEPSLIMPVLSISADRELLTHIRSGYMDDPWCKKLMEAEPHSHGVSVIDDVLYICQHLVVPQVNEV